MCEHMQQVLHVKQEDLRIYDATNEESPELLDDETKTVEELGFKDGHKILVESMGNYLSTLSVCLSLSVCLLDCLSVCLSIYHSVCLPVFFCSLNFFQLVVRIILGLKN